MYKDTFVLLLYMNICDLQTGDILLISNYEKGWFNLFLDMIRYGTHSDYVHIGIVVMNG